MSWLSADVLSGASGFSKSGNASRCSERRIFRISEFGVQDLVELWIIHSTCAKLFVETVENGHLKEIPPPASKNPEHCTLSLSSPLCTACRQLCMLRFADRALHAVREPVFPALCWRISSLQLFTSAGIFVCSCTDKAALQSASQKALMAYVQADLRPVYHTQSATQRCRPTELLASADADGRGLRFF